MDISYYVIFKQNNTTVVDYDTYENGVVVSFHFDQKSPSIIKHNLMIGKKSLDKSKVTLVFSEKWRDSDRNYHRHSFHQMVNALLECGIKKEQMKWKDEMDFLFNLLAL